MIFAGTSRMAQGIHRVPIRAWSRRSFNLGVGPREGYRFTRDIVLQLDLRPRLLVANVDDYFVEPYSVETGRVLREDWFTRRKTLILGTSTALWRTLQHHLPSSVARYDYFPARWRIDGTQFLPGLLERQGPRAPGQPVALEGPDVPASPGRLEQVRDFRDLLASRGTQLVLTHVPSSDLHSPGWSRRAEALGRRLDVPVLLPSRGGLETWDGSHLAARSARRFTAELLSELDEWMEAPRR